MAETETPLSEAFVRIAELGTTVPGAAPLHRHEGAWLYRFTDASGNEWGLAVNGHKYAVPDTLLDLASPIEPLTALVTFNGWPFGVLDPFGGQMGAGEIANEDAFIAALIAETERVRTLSVQRAGDSE